jgi:hypothetical protein
MWQYRTDTSRNRLYVAVSGGIAESETPAVIRGIVQAINLLKPGFAVISDLSQIPESDPQRSVLLDNLQDAAERFGASRVIHVRKRLGSEAAPKSWPCVSYQGCEARSVEEADQMLNDQTVSGSLRPAFKTEPFTN